MTKKNFNKNAAQTKKTAAKKVAVATASVESSTQDTNHSVEELDVKNVNDVQAIVPDGQAGSEQAAASQIVQLPLSQISPSGLNPRKHFDDESLAELAQNIAEHGLLQPITVRTKADGTYEIIFGERRFRASKIAGKESIPCIVKDLDDDRAFDLMISENLQRLDILPSEEAQMFNKLTAKGFSVNDIAERYGKSQAFIHKRLSLCNLMPEIIQLLDRNEISVGVAFEISCFEAEIQADIYEQHLATEQPYNSWKNVSVKIFREKLEQKYTTLLSRFEFDKTECLKCASNTELRSLFPNSANSRCTKRACMFEKHVQFMVDSTVALVGSENLGVYIGIDSPVNTELVERLHNLGIEVQYDKIRMFPSSPQLPEKEDYADETDYIRAMDDYYSAEADLRDVHDRLADGTAKKVVSISYSRPVIGYVLVSQPEISGNTETDASTKADVTPQGRQGDCAATASDSGSQVVGIQDELIRKFKQKDESNKVVALEQLVAGIRKLLSNNAIPGIDITAFENDLFYYILLGELHPNRFPVFGLTGKIMTESDRFALFYTLTDEQKNVLKRDFILKSMLQTSGNTKKSALLIELSKLHFPEETARLEAEQTEEYTRKRAVLEAQLEKLQAKAKDVTIEQVDVIAEPSTAESSEGTDENAELKKVA